MEDSSDEDKSYEQHTLEKYLDPVKEVSKMDEATLNMSMDDKRTQMKLSLYEVLKQEGLNNMSSFKDEVFNELTEIKGMM